MKNFKRGYQAYRRIGYSRLRSLYLQVFDSPLLVRWFG